MAEVTEEDRARTDAMSALLDALFATAPVGLAFHDRDGRYLRVNEELARMHGLPAEAHLGARAKDLFGESGARVTSAIDEVLAKDEPIMDLPLVYAEDSPDRADRHFETSLFPVHAADGETLGVGSVVRDVTERHDAEAERTGLLKDAFESRAQAEAEKIRAEDAREQAEDARGRMAFLARAGARMASSLDYDTTLRDVAASAVPAIADWCAITIDEPTGGMWAVAVAHSDPTRRRWAEDVLKRWPPGESSPIVEVALTGKPVLFDHIDEELVLRLADDEEHAQALREFGACSLMAVALRSPSRAFGVLWLAYAESGRRYDESDLALARALAGRAALHIENARLYTERKHIAETLQRSLLPRSLPDIPGVELAASYRASGEANEVGGDFYDAFEARDGVWTIVMGDVTGKGPEAAALTALARHTLRAAARRSTDPAEDLAVLNEALLADADTTRFCTVLCAQARPGEDGVALRIATGGHPAPIHACANGSLAAVDVRGTLVGGVREARFGATDCTLNSGEMLVMFTDGATELRGEDPLEGERLLEAAIVENVGRSAKEVLAAIEAAVGDRLRDDLALLAIRAL